MIGLSEALAKMQTLSDERAARVVSLIEDLADLEARENAEDLADARAAMLDREPALEWGKLKIELDALHRPG
jgi:hypothetical protein